MSKKVFLFSFIFILVSSVIFHPKAGAQSYVLDASLSNDVYSLQHVYGSEVQHYISVDKFGAYGTDVINTKYWVHPTTSGTNGYGFKTAFNSGKLEEKGLWVADDASRPAQVSLTSWGNNIFDWNVYKPLKLGEFLAYGWSYRVKSPQTFAYFSMNGTNYHSMAGFMTSNFIISTPMDNIKVKGFKVQPNPAAPSSLITENNEIIPNNDVVLPKELETKWTYVSLETIEISKNQKSSSKNENSENAAELANTINIQLRNGADNSLLKTVSLEDYLKNHEEYKNLIQTAYNKTMNDSISE